MNCPKCGLMNTGNMAVGLAMPQCMCQWQSTQEKSSIETVPAKGTLLPKREWVGLTPEQRNDCLVEADPCECLATPEAETLMEIVEAKLKELNT